MRLIADASVVIKWLVEEPGSEHARGLLGPENEFEAPDLIIAEVCNVIWRLHRTGVVRTEQHGQLIEGLPRLFARFGSLSALAPRASVIARTLGHPIYDCFYLALAEYRRAPLVTADRRFLNAVSGSPWQGLVRDLYALGA
ncbi:type II toxin-antitoxin system VapC family toxin [Azospirillum sp. sgz302134]